MKQVDRSNSRNGLHRALVCSVPCGVVAILVTILLASPAAQATPTTHQAAAIELLDLMQAESVLNNAMQQSMDMQLKQNPALEPARPVMVDFFRRYMSWSALKGDFVRIYVKAFTEAELRELIEFYGKPTGRKAIALMPKLMENGMQLSATRVQEHMPELQKMLREKLEPSAKPSSAAAGKPASP